MEMTLVIVAKKALAKDLIKSNSDFKKDNLN